MTEYIPITEEQLDASISIHKQYSLSQRYYANMHYNQ